MVRRIAIALLGVWLSGAALGTTYTYVGPTYTGAASPYTTAMSITGTFDTAAPLPANMSLANIGPHGSALVTAWSFSDGVHTYTQANSDPGPFAFSVATDALGNVTLFDIDLISPRPPIAINDIVDNIIFANCCGPVYVAVDSATCNMVDIANECTGYPSANSGSANTFGAFTPTFTAVPPTIAKAFAASSVTSRGITSLTFTLANPNGAVSLTGVAFTDNFPAGMVIATPNGLSNTCGGVATAVQGTGSVSLAGATIGSNNSCALTVNVTATGSGQLANTTGAVTSTQSVAGNTASAMLAVTPPPIPALERWTLWLLGLLLAMVGAGAIRNRSGRALGRYE